MRYSNSRWSWIIVLVGSLSSVSLAQKKPDIREFEPGKPIERELAGGDVHAYSINLTAGQFLSVTVDQRGIDVVVALFGPDGKQLIEVDSPNGTKGPEPVSFVAKSSGAHQIKVRSSDKAAGPGRYEVKVEALRTATPREKLESQAKELAQVLASAKTDEERAMMLAQKKELVTIELVRALYEHARGFRSRRDYPQALAISRLGLSLAEQIVSKTGVADFLYNIGYVFYWQADNTEALQYLEKSLALREELGEKSKAGDSASVIALTHTQQKDPTKALEYYQRGLTLYEAAGDRVWVARTQHNIGRVLRDQGNYTQALEAFQKSSAAFEALGDKLGLANYMLDIGHTYELQGNHVAALEYRQRALTMSQALGNKALTAIALNQLGSTHFRQGNNAEALKYYQQSLELGEALGNKAQFAQTLNGIGLAQRLLGNYPQALEAAQRARKLSESLGNKALMANIMMTLGLVYSAQGNVAQALDSYQKSLIFAEEARTKPLIANALEKIAEVHHSQGNIARALDQYQRSLKLNEELGNKRQIIFTVTAIGAVHRSQGDYARATEYYRRGLKLSEEVRNKFQIATALNTLGVISSDQGDYAHALEYFRRSLKLREEIGQVPGIQGSLNNIGEVYRLQRSYAQAMEYYQKSLALAEKIGSKGAIRTALSNIGETDRLQGNYAQAMEHLRKSLALSEEMGSRLVIPETLNSMSAVSFAQGNYKEALEFAERAADIARQTGHREYLRSALAMSGRAYRALNQPDKARHSFEEAIAIGESLRSTVAGQESRASYFATVQQPYELYIDLLMHMHKQHPVNGHDALALQVTERARARSLLETLNEARADIRQGVDPTLLQRERTLQQQLNAAAEKQTMLLTSMHTEEQATAVSKEINALTAESQDVQTQIRRRSPRYAALTQPVPLNLIEIQQLLDADTLLLEYALGEDRSYLWAVTPTSITTFELPKRTEIEAAVRRAVKLLSDGKQWATSDRIEGEYAEVAGRLSQMLLAPVEAQLIGKRLLIVGDGALQFLSFGALPSPKSKVQGPKSRNGRQITGYGQPLIVEHEIVSLPSASTLAILRRETANRARPTKNIAVLADPVFERDDERVSVAATGSQTVSKAGASSASRDTNSELANSRYLLERAFGLGLQPAAAEDGASREILRIPRLPFTRREADAILAIAPAGEGMKALDFRASRETATSAELGNTASYISPRMAC